MWVKIAGRGGFVPAGVGEVLTNIALVLLFVVIGGVFAGAEIALVSLRESQIRQLRDRGGRGATVARLAEDPNRFLSAVQIGVTLMGFLSAAFGGATLAGRPGVRCWSSWGLRPGLASVVALVIITVAISYVYPCWASWCRSGWHCSAPRHVLLFVAAWSTASPASRAR